VASSQQYVVHDVMIGPLTLLDAGLIAVALISGLLAMYRGLTRELLSIVSWLLAAAAAAYLVFFQKAFAEEIAAQIGLPVVVAQIIIAAVVFLIVLVVVHLITSRISDAVLDGRVGMFDRIFGLVFGVLRGFILVVIPFLFYEKLYPQPETHPGWVRNAYSLPMIRSTGQSFEALILQYFPSIEGTSAKADDAGTAVSRLTLGAPIRIDAEGAVQGHYVQSAAWSVLRTHS
jgi:membrane protein required for colicin V production